MLINITGFGYFSKNLCVLVLWTKVASSLEGLNMLYNTPSDLFEKSFSKIYPIKVGPTGVAADVSGLNDPT